jgi:hypothetical protein
MKLSLLRPAIALLAVVALVACASLEIKTDFDSQADFGRYRRFAWLEPPLLESALATEQSTGDVLAENSLLDKRVRAAVDEGLAARGLARVEREQADLLVRYRVTIDEYLRQTGTFVGTGTTYRHRYTSVSPAFYDAYWTTRRIRDGTLIVDLIDAGSQQIVWRGWTVGRNPDGYFSQQQVDESVRRLLALFPPPRGAN